MRYNIDYIVTLIREFRKASGYAKSRYALLADVPEGSLRSMDSNDWNPTLATLKKLDSIIPMDFEPSKTKTTKPKTRSN